jgi:hypothetical protein
VTARWQAERRPNTYLRPRALEHVTIRRPVLKADTEPHSLIDIEGAIGGRIVGLGRFLPGFWIPGELSALLRRGDLYGDAAGDVLRVHRE